MVSASAPKETPENTVPFSNTSFAGLFVLICINLWLIINLVRDFRGQVIDIKKPQIN